MWQVQYEIKDTLNFSFTDWKILVFHNSHSCVQIQVMQIMIQYSKFKKEMFQYRKNGGLLNKWV